jgi:hypothetical protein
MAVYDLITAESTVQVLSPTVVNNVVYCTIQTHTSRSIASKPIQQDLFDAGGGGPELTALADAIEQIVARTDVQSATGVQTLDSNGLLADNVAFTVVYTPPGSSGTDVTAEALVPVASLNFEDGLIGATLLESVIAKIEKVYANLQATAGG